MNFRSAFILHPQNGLQEFFRQARESMLSDAPIEIRTVGVDLTNAVDPQGTPSVALPAVFFGLGNFRRVTGVSDASSEREITTVDIYTMINASDTKSLVERVGDMSDLIEMAVKQARAFPVTDDIYLERVQLASAEVDRGSVSDLRFVHFAIEYLYQYML